MIDKYVLDPRHLLIIYNHSDCIDAFSAAHLLWKKYNCTPQYYSSLADKDLCNVSKESVILINHSITDLNKFTNCKNIFIINNTDHVHTLRQLVENDDRFHFLFDENVKSLTRQSWKLIGGKQLPKLYKYVDGMVNGESLPNLKHFSSALNELNRSFEDWDTFSVSSLIKTGSVIELYTNNLVDKILYHKHTMRMGDYKIPACQAPENMVKLVGDKLCVGKLFCVVWYYKNDEITFNIISNHHGLNALDVANEFSNSVSGTERWSKFILGTIEFFGDKKDSVTTEATAPTTPHPAIPKTVYRSRQEKHLRILRVIR